MIDRRIHFSLWYFLAVVLGLLWLQVFLTGPVPAQLPYSTFKQALAAGKVRNLGLRNDWLGGDMERAFLAARQPELAETLPGQDWQGFTTVRLDDPELLPALDRAGVRYERVQESGFLKELMGFLLPFLLMLFLWQMILGRMGPGRGMLAIGKSKARVYVDKDIKVSFRDVAGIDEAVEELREVVSFLTEPTRYTKLGGRLPKGVLLVGPPGTGKTLLARAVAGEAKVPFFSLSGSEFVEMFVGVGAARVRDLFEQAQKSAPCIIFIDELDALGRARGIAQLSSNEEREQTLNQLLTEMDGFDPNRGVVLMAATNRPEILDPALLRAGRFDRQVVVDRPDVRGREAILRIHARKLLLAPDVDPAVLAVRTPGLVGADLENIVNEAALLSARADKSAVAMADFEEAIDRSLGGLQRKSSLMSATEKHRVAFHEAGHALIALRVRHGDPVHKVSIIPRGVAALGYTVQLPSEDRHLYTKSELLDRIKVLLGGRAAEDLVFDEISTGAADDLQKATDIARRLITEYGMSDALGPVAFPARPSPFLAPATAPALEVSGETGAAIDREVIALVREGYAAVCTLLQQNRAALVRVAEALERDECLSGDAVRRLVSEAEA